MIPAATPRVSVIVCCYREDRLELLEAAIASVARQSRPAHELIVVVDHDDALAARLEACDLPGAVVRNDGPTGLSGARTKGLEVATGDVVAFLDDDATVDESWLEDLVGPYTDPAVLGVGGSVVPVWGPGASRWLPPEFYWVVGCSWTGLPGEPSPTRNLIGANMSFRRDDCLAVGGFADEFFFRDRTIVNDETEFCIRLLKQRPGGRLLYLPHVVARHRVPRERTTVSYFVKRCWREGRAKRITVGMAGWDVGLSRERAHLARILPRAVLRELRRLLRGDGAAIGPILALVGGTLVTMMGFALPAHRSAW